MSDPEHLTTLAQQALSQRLTVIRAGHGYGKSRLCRDIIAAAGHLQRPASYLRMTRALELSAAGAARYIHDALTLDPLRHHLPRLLTRPDITASALGHALSDDLHALPAGTVLVFDDAHVLASTCRDFFTLAFTDLPDDLSVVFASRVDVFSSRSLKAAVIGPDELRVPATQARDLGVDDQTYQALGGWPVLVMEQSRRQGDVAGYLNDLLDVQLPRELSRALMTASALEAWMPDDPVFRSLDLPADWINQVQWHGVPLDHYPDGSVSPPPVLMSLLQHRLHRNPAWHREVLQRLGEAAQKHAPLRAARYLQAAGDADSVLRIAVRAVEEWKQRREHGALIEVLEPVRVHLDGPSQLALGVALFETGRRQEGQALVDAANRMGIPQPEGYFVAAELRMQQGQTELAYTWLKAASSPGHAATLEQRVRAHAALAVVCAELGTNGQPHRIFEATQHARAALDEVKNVTSPVLTALAATAQACAFASSGHGALARLAAVQAANFMQQDSFPEAAIGSLLTLANLLGDHGEEAQAREILMNVGRLNGTSTLVQAMLDLSLARLALRTGDLHGVVHHSLAVLDHQEAEFSLLAFQARLMLVWPYVQLGVEERTVQQLLIEIAADPAAQNERLRGTVEALMVVADVELARRKGGVPRRLRDALTSQLGRLTVQDEALALVTLVHARERRWSPFHERLLNSIRGRLGDGLVRGYASAFAFEEVQALLRWRPPLMEVKFLGRFELRVNHQPISLSTRAQLLLAALVLEAPAADREGGSARQVWAGRLYAVGSPLDTFDQARLELTRKLGEASGLSAPLGSDSKWPHMASFSVVDDVRHLEQFPIEVLVAAYSGPFLAEAGSTGNFVVQWADRIRTLIERRIQRVVDERQRAVMLEEVDRRNEAWDKVGRVR